MEDLKKPKSLFLQLKGYQSKKVKRENFNTENIFFLYQKFTSSDEEVLLLCIKDGLVFFEDRVLFELESTHAPEYNTIVVIRDLFSIISQRVFFRRYVQKRISFA